MPTRPSLRDCWRTWKNSDIPLLTRIDWAVSDFCAWHPRIALALFLALLCLMAYGATSCFMGLAHPPKGA